jgi:RNA ligase (TIGR02306 family)
MSELETKVIELTEVIPHPDPETTALEIAVVGGWNMVVQKGLFKTGDMAVYIHLDSVLPVELSDYLNVTKYLVKGRVKAAGLRGVPSYGLLQPVDVIEKYLNETLKFGDELSEKLKITKYEPPLNFTSNDIAKYDNNIDPLFVKYTDIVNIKDYINIIQEGEDVIETEKIHGRNCRLGLINGQFVAGSHDVRMKENSLNSYWSVMTENVKDILRTMSICFKSEQVILFGELYGEKMQDSKFRYGLKNKVEFRLFDILVQGKYLDFNEMSKWCYLYDVTRVPILNRREFKYRNLKDYEGRKSNLSDETMLEGIVIRPVKERSSGQRRCIAKYVLDQYLLRKKGTEYK